MWSEEEMRDIEPEPPAPHKATRSLATGLRHTLTSRSRASLLDQASPVPHELTRGSAPGIIYAPQSDTHGNFIAASYRRILATPAWNARLTKVHTAKRQARPLGPDEETRLWKELDSSNSSDALLMNIFCYPRIFARAPLRALLDVDAKQKPVFGYRPQIDQDSTLPDRTEIDMKLGGLLVEAKLTESGFQTAPWRLVERYPGFTSIFDREALPNSIRGVQGYQLIRGILAAQAESARFCLLCDGRRPDLIEAWYSIVRAVKHCDLRSRLHLVTWQEIAATLPRPLQHFLADKYGIEPPSKPK